MPISQWTHPGPLIPIISLISKCAVRMQLAEL